MAPGIVPDPYSTFPQAVLGYIFAGVRIRRAKEDGGIAVGKDVIPAFVITFLDRGKALEDDHTGDFILSHRSELLRELRDLAYVGKLIK